MKFAAPVMLALAALGLSASPAAAAPTQPRIGDVVMGKKGQPTVTVILSLSCVFCRALDKELFAGKAQALVRKGYAIEIIPVVATKVDEATTAALRCGPPKGYVSRLRRLYASSSLFKVNDADAAKAKLLDRAADYGLTRPQLQACFAAKAMKANENMTTAAAARYQYPGTPSLYLDDKFLGHTINDLPGS